MITEKQQNSGSVSEEAAVMPGCEKIAPPVRGKSSAKGKRKSSPVDELLNPPAAFRPKSVWISISNRQRNGEGEEDTLLFDTAGSWLFDGSVGILSYAESEITGLEGTVTHVAIMPDQVVVKREGTFHSLMMFREGHRDSVPYDTPFGQMLLGVDTRAIRHSINEQGGSMEIDYTTDISHRLLSHNRFSVSVKETENPNG